MDQEVQYILSGKDGLVHSDDTKLQKELNKYFNRKFKNALSEVITGAITKGFEYMYAYVNKKGRLTFERADSLGVIEVRERETDDGCAYVIYWYIDKLTKDNKAIKRIQVWDENQTYYYVQEENGRLLLDDSKRINPRPHVIYTKDGDNAIYYENFGYIPFFRLDNNKKQHSGVKAIKSLIDDYDMMACGLSNNLADFDHPTYVVKGFEGNDFEELQTNLKTKKMIGTPEGGGLEVHTIEVPYQARIANMDKDEENIYRFGMGFNSAQVGDGNVTNVVIKSRYALLDLKCNKLQARIEEFLDNILEVVLKEINKNNKTDYDIDDVYYSFSSAPAAAAGATTTTTTTTETAVAAEGEEKAVEPGKSSKAQDEDESKQSESKSSDSSSSSSSYWSYVSRVLCSRMIAAIRKPTRMIPIRARTPARVPKSQSTKLAIVFMGAAFRLVNREEECRVGKECRSRWSLYH